MGKLRRVSQGHPLLKPRGDIGGKGVAFGIDKMTGQNFQTIGQVLKKGKAVSDRDKYFSQEFQAYGYYLARELNDLAHKALYIKYAKTVSRGLLDEALSFVKNAGKVKSKARLFMWKLKLLLLLVQKK